VAITELPEFIATQYFADRQLEPILTDWSMPEGGLYFVTPTARTRPAKVSALAEFFITRLTAAQWSMATLSLNRGRSRPGRPR
jgi:DNA-binding transcriptional LysR family regulator